MKTKLSTLKLLTTLCCAFAAVPAFGQYTLTWVGGAGVDFGNTNNWVGNIFAPISGTTCVFNGSQAGNLVLVSSNGIQPGGSPIGSSGADGITIQLASGQTGSVQLICATNLTLSLGMGFSGAILDNGVGSLILGDDTANQLILTLRPSPPSIHGFTNNSANPMIWMPNAQIQNGGGAAGHVMVFAGTGDFGITNNLRWNNASPAGEIEMDGTGTLYWTAGGPNDLFNSGQGPININSGTVVLKSASLLPNTAGLNLVTNNATLIFDAAGQSDTIGRLISGTGQLIVNDGSLTLTADNTYTGSTTVSNGTLIINGANIAAATYVYGGTLAGDGTLSGPVTLTTGTTLAPGSSVGTLTINNNLAIGGNLFIEVNKSLSPSNDFVAVSGVLTNTGTGTVTVKNLGPALAVGDKFTLFSQPVLNGAALTVTGSGVNWDNHLATDGSISVNSFVPAPTLNFTQSSDSLQFSWTDNRFKLQWQTNDISVGLSSNWMDYPGGDASPVTVPMDATNGTVFFRLVPLP